MVEEGPNDHRINERPMGTADLARAPDRQSDGAISQNREARDETSAPLLPDDEIGALRRQWDAVQTGFVDEPRRSVELADQLVAGAMTRLAEVFASERSQLENQWDRGDDVSTEDLRIALQRYRAFFARLLSI
ncbi:hypothetical protein [Allopontixanthobacter sp.]|uniref:hypothetical protein n=1 Tax=Allopontixanthobacter sp. TaxID=2906452 RepID=UPI002AB8A1A3|nr:hypothetical protein [Allopontixanthobacter sp.]MDZ4306676.1 hypothetical protein [Allopontixanthobacter sp.]